MKQKRNENTQTFNFFNFFKFKILFNVYFYLYLIVNGSAVTLLCPNLSPSVCVGV